MKSVVEGVETEEQVRFLKQYYCDSVQGYYYYRPMPADDFNEVLLEAFGDSSEQVADHKITVKDCYDRFNGNYEEAKQRLMDDKRIERFMLKFLSDDTMDQIKDAITRENYEGLHRAVHTLKGLAANLSFTELQYAAEDFADQLDRTRGTVDPSLLENLELCYARVVETIEEYKAQKLLNS